MGNEPFVSFLDKSTLEQLCQMVNEQHVSITITFTPEQNSVEIYPWKAYNPICPYGKEGYFEHETSKSNPS